MALDSGELQRVGVVEGDVLVYLGDVQLGDSRAIDNAKLKYGGSKAVLRVNRDGVTLDFDIQVGPLGVSVDECVTFDPNDRADVALHALNRAVAAMVVSTLPPAGPYDCLGVVGAERVVGINLLKDFAAAVVDLVGGNSGAVQDEISRARTACVQAMAVDAAKLGATAVHGIQFSLSEFSGGGKSMLMLMASGTAVRLIGGAS